MGVGPTSLNIEQFKAFERLPTGIFCARSSPGVAGARTPAKVFQSATDRRQQ
jgi:hypothetical protein